jgi:hypothetical protein
VFNKIPNSPYVIITFITIHTVHKNFNWVLNKNGQVCDWYRRLSSDGCNAGNDDSYWAKYSSGKTWSRRFKVSFDFNIFRFQLFVIPATCFKILKAEMGPIFSYFFPEHVFFISFTFQGTSSNFYSTAPVNGSVWNVIRLYLHGPIILNKSVLLVYNFVYEVWSLILDLHILF